MLVETNSSTHDQAVCLKMIEGIVPLVKDTYNQCFMNLIVDALARF
jgi:hypothetical protein